jgi:glycosyltransferase involved in cell wall biosynthesis
VPDAAAHAAHADHDPTPSGRFQVSRIPTQHSAPGDLQVMITIPAWSVMRSTDRDYNYNRFPLLNRQFKLHFRGNYGLRSLLWSNALYTLQRFAPNLRLEALPYGSVPGVRVPRAVQVMFAYGSFPMDLETRVPILWEHTFAPQRGSDELAWQAQLRREHMLAATRATSIVTATQPSAAWFRRIFPEFSAKVTAIPYYLPHLSAAPAALLEQRAADSGKLRILFVGKQARRKGLPALVAAWALLGAGIRRQLQITVVSAMFDGSCDLPAEWVHHSSVPDVSQLMRESHVFAFPTQHEAYGLVLVEALAAGCAVVTTSAEIQRSIVGAAAGSFIDPSSPSELAQALSQLVADRVLLRDKMLAARARFAEHYEPSVVGAQYARLLWDTAGCAVEDVAR